MQNGVSTDPNAAAQDLAFWTSMQQYTLNNAHYFCETADLSRPFPSTFAAQDPAPEFVWNSWLREPLRSLGLQELCPTLLQVRANTLGRVSMVCADATAALHSGLASGAGRTR